MNVIDIPLSHLREARWNANTVDEGTLARLGESIRRYGLVQNLVVRALDTDTYEVLSGNQRLKLLKEAHMASAPCVVVNVDDAHARLLAEALNRIHGEDDLGLRAELLRNVLAAVPESQVLAILPETANSLSALASIGKETVADYLQNWQRAQAARLKHLQLQLTPAQLEVVEEALAVFLPQACQTKRDSPNIRGTALYLLCKTYLESKRGEE